MKLSQYDTIMFIVHTHHVEKRPKKKTQKTIFDNLIQHGKNRQKLSCLISVIKVPLIYGPIKMNITCC
jgi:hypothetical protein